MASEDAKPRLYSEAELMSDKAVEAAAKAMFESRVKQAQERIGLRKFDTDELFSFYSGLTFESDRAVAILSFTYTETVLERLFSEEIDCHFIGGDSAIISPGGVLDTVTKRLKIAAALGWISEHTYKNITRLARIRNRFAHRVGIDNFEHPDIKDLIGSIESYEIPVLGVMKDLPELVLGQIFLLRSILATTNLIHEMLSVPVAIRMGLPPGAVMGRSFDDIPENLKEVRRAAAKAAGIVIYLPKEVEKMREKLREETRAAGIATVERLETEDPDDPEDL